MADADAEVREVLSRRRARLAQRARRRVRAVERRLERDVPLLAAAGIETAPSVEEAAAGLRAADDALAAKIDAPPSPRDADLAERATAARAAAVARLHATAAVGADAVVVALDGYVAHAYPHEPYHALRFWTRTLAGDCPCDRLVLERLPAAQVADPDAAVALLSAIVDEDMAEMLGWVRPPPLTTLPMLSPSVTAHRMRADPTYRAEVMALCQTIDEARIARQGGEQLGLDGLG